MSNKPECCRQATSSSMDLATPSPRPLHEAINPRMYKELTVKTPGCVAFSLPVQRRNFRSLRNSGVFPIPPRPAQRAADKEGRFRARAASCPRLLSLSGDSFSTRHDRLSGPQGLICDDWQAPWRGAGLSAKTRRPFAADDVQTGRRLMRQTVLPTTIQGINAPTRSESLARRVPAGSHSARRLWLRFGLPLTPESGGPSRHPAARYALAVNRGSRRHEFQNAQQNVDRRHAPGRDPGRCGPRQSSRRI
jgi:hypothetical protein